MAICLHAGKVTVDKAGIRFANRRSVFVDQVPTEVPDEKKDEVISSGMVLPFEPLSLVFSHIDYFVPLPKVLQTRIELTLYSCGT